MSRVRQITFSGDYANRVGQKVFYITERAVFQLTPAGVELIEIAPGVNLERDVLAQIEGQVNVSPNLKIMDERIFVDKPMRLSIG